jgi:hypothetical protein
MNNAPIIRRKAADIVPGDIIVAGLGEPQLVDAVFHFGAGPASIAIDTHDGDRTFYNADMTVTTIEVA